MNLRALYQRLSGAEAASLRHQRDAYAEQAGLERRRADIVGRERDAARASLATAKAHAEALQDALVALIETYDGVTGDVREAYGRCAVFGHDLPLEELAGRLLGSERLNPLRRQLRAAQEIGAQISGERDTAVELLRALVTGCASGNAEHALAGAVEWLRRRESRPGMTGLTVERTRYYCLLPRGEWRGAESEHRPMTTARVGKLTTRDNGDLLMVEYVDGEILGAVTTKAGYDFNESKEWGTLFHAHGGSSCYLSPFVGAGPDKPTLGEVWIADGVEVTDAGSGKPLSRKEIRAFGYRILPAPHGDPFEDARDCDRIEWCRVCDDYMPDDSDTLCSHLFWLDDVADVCGPGGDEEFFEDFTLPVVEMASRAGIARRWRKALRSGAAPGWKVSSAVDDAIEDMGGRWGETGEPARRWFEGLDALTTEANKATIEWLDLVIQTQDERRASGALVYAIRAGAAYETDEEHAVGEREPAETWWTYKRADAIRRTWADALDRARELRARRVNVRIVFVRCGKASKGGEA